MASSKEERERRRAERLEAERREAASARRRLLLGYVVAGLLTLAVVAGIAVAVTSGGGDESAGGEDVSELPDEAQIEPLSGSINEVAPDGRAGTTPPAIQQADLEIAAKDAGCDLQLDLPDEGNTHFESVNEAPEYKTNPATSGDHITTPRQQADGAYSEPVAAPMAVHALEHGRIAIQYSPKLPEDDQLALKGIFDESPAAVLLFPNPDMPYAVAATAWTQLIGCEAFEGPKTLDALRAFRDIYRGQGPEPVPLQLSG
jgi:hypothetical protein